MITALSMAACLLSLVPLALFLRNVALYRPLPPADQQRRRCSVLIPARNEEANIADALDSVLMSDGMDLEVIVLDDDSADCTAEIVRRYAARDARVRLAHSVPLPPGWCGKNHACQQLAALARHPLLVFMDADVRILRADSLARLAHFADATGAGLVSGVPHEETAGFLEKLIVPLIHFVLLAYLPIKRMRRCTDPRFAAACGQIVAVRRDAYERSGGHAAIAGSLHDGVALARSMRQHGFNTDLFDATETFRCRMYRRASEVWLGFAKNAHEGLATRRLIVPATLLLGGQVLPIALLAAAPSPMAAIAAVASLAPRIIAVRRFRQSLLGALLHPLGVALLVAIQWHAFVRTTCGKSTTWRGRAYPSPPRG